MPFWCAVADAKQRNLMAAEFYGKEYVLFEGGTLNNAAGACPAAAWGLPQGAARGGIEQQSSRAATRAHASRPARPGPTRPQPLALRRCAIPPQRAHGACRRRQAALHHPGGSGWAVFQAFRGRGGSSDVPGQAWWATPGIPLHSQPRPNRTPHLASLPPPAWPPSYATLCPPPPTAAHVQGPVAHHGEGAGGLPPGAPVRGRGGAAAAHAHGPVAAAWGWLFSRRRVGSARRPCCPHPPTASRAPPPRSLIAEFMEASPASVVADSAENLCGDPLLHMVHTKVGRGRRDGPPIAGHARTPWGVGGRRPLVCAPGSPWPAPPPTCRLPPAAHARDLRRTARALRAWPWATAPPRTARRRSSA